MESSARTLEADDRANELYWGSDRSVNQIAEDLDLSKGALYGMIRPLAASRGCPVCGAEVVHPNRTAKERMLVDCPSCGWEGSERDTAPGFEALPAEASDDVPTAPPLRRESGDLPGAVLGGALLGAAAGLALLFWVRRR